MMTKNEKTRKFTRNEVAKVSPRPRVLQPNFTVDRKGEAAIKERQLQEVHQD